METLKKLTTIAIIGFFCYFLLALENSELAFSHYRSPSFEPIWLLAYYFVSVVRCIATLMIITMRDSKKTEREKSWLEQRVSIVEEKLSLMLSTKSNKSV